MEGFFQKTVYHEGTKAFLRKNKYGEIVLNRSTDDKIMAMFGRSFINDKYIFLVYRPNLSTKSSLED